MHLSKQLVRLGEHIRTGQLIAESGATGAFCKGAHLHFQLMRGDHPTIQLIQSHILNH